MNQDESGGSDDGGDGRTLAPHCAVCRKFGIDPGSYVYEYLPRFNVWICETHLAECVMGYEPTIEDVLGVMSKDVTAAELLNYIKERGIA